MNLNLENDNQNLLFPTPKGINKNSSFTDEITLSESRDSSENGKIELLKKDGKITEYESFPSFSNSVKNTFSSITTSDKTAEIRPDYSNLTVIEKISNFFGIWKTEKRNLEIRKKNFVIIVNENVNENENKIGDDGERDDNGNEDETSNISGKENSSIKNGNHQNNGNYEKNGKTESVYGDKYKITEKNRIEHNKKTLNLDKKQIQAISRFYAHSRIQEPYSENVILSLPSFIEKYKKEFVLFMLTTFSLIILLTITMSIWNAIVPENDDIALVSAEFVWSH